MAPIAVIVPTHSMPKTNGNFLWDISPCRVYKSAKLTPPYSTFTSILSAKGGNGNCSTCNFLLTLWYFFISFTYTEGIITAEFFHNHSFTRFHFVREKENVCLGRAQQVFVFVSGSSALVTRQGQGRSR